MQVAAAILVWVAFAAWAWRIAHNPRGDVPSGLAWWSVKIYCKIYHGLRVSGREHIPGTPTVLGRPIIIVANHTAGLDPVLLQAVVPYFVRWMMAADMVGHGLEELWKFCDVILVDRSGKQEIAGVREGLRALSNGQCLGVFPEGRLRRSAKELNEFQAGIGLLVGRSGALVLPAVIRGTPHYDSSWTSLFLPSRSRIEFHPLIDYKTLGIRTGDIANDLRRRYVTWLNSG